MEAEDAEVVAAIAAEAPGEGWTAAAFEREATTNAGARYIVAEAGSDVSTVVAYGGLWLVVDLAHVTNMGVKGELVRRGLGRLVLYCLFDVARRSGIDAVTLEVRVSNEAALGLYREFGFYETGRRQAYYRDTGEDALIMTTESLESAPVRERLAQTRERIGREWPGVTPELSDSQFVRWIQAS